MEERLSTPQSRYISLVILIMSLSVGQYYSVNIFDGTDQESLLHFSWFHDAELLTGPQFEIRLVMDLVTISLSISANSSQAPGICTILTCWQATFTQFIEERNPMIIVEANMKMLILPEFLSFPLTFISLSVLLDVLVICIEQ